MPRDLGISLAAAPVGRPLGIRLPQAAAATPDVSAPEAALDQFARGALSDFGDEFLGVSRVVGAKTAGALARAGLWPRSLPDPTEDAARPAVELYRAGRDASRAQDDAVRQAHPTISTVARIAGGIAPAALVPGAGEASLGRALLTNAALGGAGALGASEADLTDGDVGGAVRDTAAGAAIGGAVGAAAPAVGKVVGRAAAYLGDKAKLLAAGALKGSAHDYGTLGPDEVRELGDWLLRKRAVRFGDTFENVAPRVGDIRGEAGAAYAKALEQLDNAGAAVSPRALAQRFMDLAAEAESRGPGNQAVVDRYLNAAADVETRAAQLGGRDLTASEAELWKQGYQDVAFPGGRAPREPTALQLADRRIASTARGMVEEAADEAATSAGVADAFKAAKQDYGAAKTAGRLLDGAESRATARNTLGPSDKAAGLAALVYSHNPVAGLAAAGANKVVRERAAASMATSAAGLSRGLTKLQRLVMTGQTRGLGRYGALLAGALQRGGPAEFSAHTFVLGQSDPAFQELTQRLANERDADEDDQ